MKADTFLLESDLKGSRLTIVLKDLIDWKIYAKTYTNDDLGKAINLKVDLEDIFYAVSCTTSDSGNQAERFLMYKFG